MTRIRVAIIGAGNISNTRHIPALKKIPEVELFGVLSNKPDRAQSTAEKHGIPHYETINSSVGNLGGVDELEWFKQVDAVAIGAPPHQHYELAKLALTLDKHVLVEKPMMMSAEECDELISLAHEKNKVFYVMHNFQYARKMQQLNELVATKKYGDIQTITEVQFTNHDRRLPEWYNDLPMGLFYDEAAHFMYLLELHAGKLTIDNSHAVYDSDPEKTTPRTLTVNATAGTVPVTMMLNFQSPVCEWYYIVNFKKRIVIYDFFKDILIDIPTDNEHLAGDILRSALLQTWQFWSQFIANGFRMVTGNLLYGHDVVMQKYITAVSDGDIDRNLTAENGRTNVVSINEIVEKANQRA